jgi:3-oxoacyl-[acyl-carrier-protein] synthase II
MNRKRKVVVTGLGLATSLGLGVEENWQKLLAGESGIKKLELPGAEKSPVQAVGAVSNNDWNTIRKAFSEDAGHEGEKRTLFALWAARAALEDANFVNSGNRNRYGVVMAAGLGINRLEDIQHWANKDNTFDVRRFGSELGDIHNESIVRNNSHRPSALIADRFGLSGYNSTITTACASASQAIGTGYRAIHRGDADLIVAGGADSMINPVGLIFFVLLKAAAVSADDPSEACRPFDRKRSGLVMGEGSGVVILEEESHALKRGADIYAEIAGYASTMDAFKVTAPHPKGAGAEHAMRSALHDANMDITDIDYINAHGTSTKLNHSAETTAIKKVFKDNAYTMSINSSKSVIGHLIAASGGPELVYTVLSVSRDQIHPTVNLNNPDPKCDLDYVPNIMKSRTVRAAISNSFGFGGQNASIAVKKYIR